MSTRANDDRLMACKDCGDNFVWTAEERAFYQGRGYEPPKRCKPCRQAKKAERAQRGGAR